MDRLIEGSTALRRQRFLVGCVVAAAVLVFSAGVGLLWLLGHVNDIGEAAGQVETARKAYVAAGMPWEARELRPDRPLADEKNAAPLLRKAFALFDEKRFNGEFAEMRGRMDSGLSVDLGPFRAGLETAVAATGRPSADFGHDFDLGPTLLFPELASMKGLTKGLCMRAEGEARRGDKAGVVRDISAAWRLGDLASGDPTIISVLVGIACRSIALDCIQRCLPWIRDDVGTLRLIRKVLNGAKPIDFYRALRGESYQGLATIRNLKQLGGIESIYRAGSGPAELDLKHVVRTGVPADSMSRALIARHLQAWTLCKAEMDAHPGEPELVCAAMDRIARSMEEKKAASYVLISILFPVFSHAGTAVVTSSAQTLATRALLTGLEVTAGTGRVPGRLSEIPGDWIDPFSGKPLLLRKDGKSFRVYSVGPNRKDDGGVFRIELKDKDSRDYDVGAAYPRAVRKI